MKTKRTLLLLVALLALNFNGYSQSLLGGVLKAIISTKKTEKAKVMKGRLSDIKKEQMKSEKEPIESEYEISEITSMPSSSVVESPVSQINKDDVTIVVSGEGKNTEEATKIALRSAISQVYGIFVSANTTLLNDNLVADEIITITNGNIKHYTELANVKLPNGNVSISLSATVSISKLVTYAKSKGASTEFAGNTFAMNMKMRELNKQSEMKALNNLLIQVKELLPFAFDRTLVIAEPVETNRKHFTDIRMTHDYYEPEITNLMYKGGDAARLLTDELTSFTSLSSISSPGYKKIFNSITNWLNSASNSYLMRFNIQFNRNLNTLELGRLIKNTLAIISVSKSEMEDLGNHNMQVSRLKIYYGILSPEDDSQIYVFRGSHKDILEWLRNLESAFFSYFTNFSIVDNTNVLSKISDDFDVKCWPIKRGYDKYFSKYHKFICGRDVKGYFMKGSGLFSPYLFLGEGLFKDYSYWDNDWEGKYANEHDETILRYLTLSFSNNPSLVIDFLMPKSSIANYSNFTIENKH